MTEAPFPDISLDDIIRHAFKFLSVRDVCVCARTCKGFANLAREEWYWQFACEQLIRQEAGFQRLGQDNLRDIKSWMGASTYNVVYRCLIKLGCWPEGVWRCPHDYFHPDGEVSGMLMLVHRKPGGILCASLFSRGKEPLCYDLRLQEKGADWPVWTTFAEPQRERVHLTGAPSSLGNGSLELKFAATPHWNRRLHRWKFRGMSWLEPSQLKGQDLDPFCQNRYAFCCGIPTPPLPRKLPDLDMAALSAAFPAIDAVPYLDSATATVAFPAREALRRLEGVWKGAYGGHGVEHVWVSMTSKIDPKPPRSLAWDQEACLQLQGLMITGDPNVPAGKLSFVVWDLPPVLGRYDGTEMERIHDSGPLVEVNRPVVSFGEQHGMTWVDLAERPIAARFQGLGQINRDIRRWLPEWVQLQLLVYEDARPLLTLLWTDQGSHFRHLMDFVPMEAPASAHAPLRELL